MNNKDRRFNYGWVVVAVSFLTLFLVMGIRFSFGIFYIAILDEYGWGRAETAGAFSVSMLFHAIFSPVTGTLIDRLGPRKFFPMGATFFFLGLLAATQIRAIWHVYIIFGVVIAIGMNTLAYSPNMSIIPMWFVKRRGLASGVVLSGVGLGTLVLVPLNEMMIAGMGWRSAFLVLSGIILFILVPVTAIFHRGYPGEMGSNPVGRISEKEEEPTGQQKEDMPSSNVTEYWTFAAAARVKAFWLMVLVLMCDGFINYMLLVHQAVYLVDAGYSKLLAASIVGLVGIMGSAGGILCGFLSDHIGRKSGYTLASISVFIGILFLISIKNAHSPWMLYVFALLYGLGYGGKLPMYAAITGDIFPGHAIGRILSIQSIGFGIGGALGAYIGGYFYDQTGSYFIPFNLLLAGIILGVISIRMAVPRRC
ncbi:MAG: MFS transporter [Deltaproteobacteria bacterium]|nr:MFS transporter [Deltaproteobacteria bacterium]